ncbi:MAG: Xaa-Pro peptidase family protein [candidate division KSB1 bacterium]|nr:Xaa-Pro peptidase family protein [candidate division KSB1 bacterium]
MIKEKIDQAIEILNEKKIDLWLIFVRESHSLPDPSLELILGSHCTWQSALFIPAKGETTAIVGNLDAEAIKDTPYQNVIAYTASIRKPLLETMEKINPSKIAINFSLNDYMSDGLTHGMYMLLRNYFKDTPYIDRFVSSESIISAVRGRKSSTEIERMKEAIDVTLNIFDKVTGHAKPGMSEKNVADFIRGEVEKHKISVSWDPSTCPSVFTGPDTAGAHYGPTGRLIKPGHIMNIDFGVKVKEYCSDLQRTWYFLKPGETDAPPEVHKAFNTVRDAIQLAADFLKPGVQGWEVDDVARKYIVSQGYEEYPHALGHQIGRAAHDGAGILCPIWERYGDLPYLKVEEGQVYTIEPRVTCDGYGVATIEEEVVVTENGCEFISNPQKELFLIG